MLHNPTDCSPLDSSVHGRLQARILQRAAISCFRASCQPRDLTHVSCTGRRVLYHRATWEAFSAPYINLKTESPCHPTAPLLTMLSGKDENWNSKIHAPSVHSSTIHNSEEMDPRGGHWHCGKLYTYGGEILLCAHYISINLTEKQN